jgi:hypothetical protein
VIDSTPSWTFTARYPLTQWYGHVHLLSSKVLGQWACFDRHDGSLVWEQGLWRPNTIVEIQDGIIVATEMRSDGPWTADFGCYGISLDTGKLLWTSHGSGWWGRFLRLLDFVPGFTNDLRDDPNFVQGQECFCNSGRIIDLHSGKDVRRIPRGDVDKSAPQASDDFALHYAKHNVEFLRVQVGEDRWLAHRRPEDVPGPTGFLASVFQLCLLDGGNSVIWFFDLASTGYKFGSYRYAAPFVYVVVSEGEEWRDHPTIPQAVVPNPTRFHVLTLELDSGTIAQDVLIDERQLTHCKLEDADSIGLVISFALPESKMDRGNQLKYYRVMKYVEHS